MTLRITDYLVADHVRLHELLIRARDVEGFDAIAFTTFRGGLLRHIGIEEKLLFPVVRRARGGEVLPAARALRIDHAALTSLLVPTPDAALCDEILVLLREHDAKEEGADGVYAACERYLGASESAALGAQAAAFQEVRVMPHFDGPGTHRTAAAALAAARRTTRPGNERAL